MRTDQHPRTRSHRAPDQAVSRAPPSLQAASFSCGCCVCATVAEGRPALENRHVERSEQLIVCMREGGRWPSCSALCLPSDGATVVPRQREGLLDGAAGWRLPTHTAIRCTGTADCKSRRRAQKAYS
ncbi:hypothetical protein BDV95DRAFT_130131 [Massariosphaeria phaeospora]|uniref:Uncharacterized protein n=1 Tax=Massariosphaeria phaeospora TaxID=100035 RepID=A0A7C8M4S1_9PLEO|nr:hypothetical protein BDV95DRAFT_130131 [Massariosphaeria phaeospora]